MIKLGERALFIAECDSCLKFATLFINRQVGKRGGYPVVAFTIKIVLYGESKTQVLVAAFTLFCQHFYTSLVIHLNNPVADLFKQFKAKYF